ncbi:inner-membrane translocator [Burkholderia ubonensis]|uniref:ABC transporter permease subunit n=1 Tax=Burkholderia ubonensis TaxID=101571 RepID=UPI00075E47D7|nr:inner-membrane translocator [Burkholderia ubonensis]KWE64042.1 inner-membrane translocator [Burkholderia ubonensis]KWE76543.1 inner-membrane translocator [Burkholderia ubonensis]
MTLLANFGLLAFLALSAYVLAIGGDWSFGQQAPFALGAYAGAAATVLLAWPLAAALALAAAVGVAAGLVLRALTLRLHALGFSLATLAAAETVRQALAVVRVQRPGADGEPVGPNGAEGFAGIRYVFEHGMTPGDVALVVWSVLALVLAGLVVLERTRFGRALRMTGEDPALGGALYAHCNTYVEPDNFDVMLGIHGLSYALIGGLGAPLGAFAGVAVDLGVLEGSRLFHGYRMIVFGGLVAVILVVRPRGLIDEALVAKLCGWNATRIRRVMRVFSLSPLLLPRRLRRRAARRQPEQT